MLNKIWAGLIIISIVFAMGHDIRDEINHSYGNGETLKVSYDPGAGDDQVILHYQDRQLAARIAGEQLIIPVTPELPKNLQFIADKQPSNDNTQIKARISNHDSSRRQLAFILPEIHWVRLKDITRAAFDMAEFAVKLALGLAGIMALWLGLMQVAEQSGLIRIFVRLVHPLLGWLFPQIPRDHPAMGSISLNLAANVLGLGNAATPLGIRAMQQLQTLNHKKDRASDAMCMFLALNTSSVQLLPPVTLIALMGAGISELLPAIILATTASTLAAIISVKLYLKLGRL
ncbi:MAG TPA: nucleoside recognition domain-containing protein [Pseudomonadales bacterium]